jgi:hypothetical protein
MSGIGVEAAMIAAYACFLMLAALCLDLLARHTHRRSDRYRLAGFDFHRALDAWTCPEGEHLRRSEIDHERRLIRYRARAEVCNACPAKPDCTESDTGREVVRSMDPWPHSEAGRFHRGICVVLLGLALVILMVGLARDHSPSEIALLGGLAMLGAAALCRGAASFGRTPTGFPEVGVRAEVGMPTRR